MLKESPKDKPTNQLEQNTVEIPQEQSEQGHGEDDTDFPVPQRTEEVTDLSATFEQSNNAMTENTAQRTKAHRHEREVRHKVERQWRQGNDVQRSVAEARD